MNERLIYDAQSSQANAFDKQDKTKSRETSGLEGKQNKLVSQSVIFLDFHFNSNERITGANQNSRLGTSINTNQIFKTTE